jgi:hypothetical protein
MDEFRTTAKLWPAGTDIGSDTDSTLLTLTPPDSANFTRTAAPFVTSDDGTQTYQFLFWNTGRHMTSKRKVTWIFTRFGWHQWTATRWYGPHGGSGGPPPPPRVRADAFSIASNQLLSADSPIDFPASTFSAGAGPFNGDDHAIGTAAAGATVVAHGHMGAYDFASWLRLVWGGDPTGDFIETDSGTSGGPGSSGFYDAAVAAGSDPLAVATGEYVDVLATYEPHVLSIPGGGPHGPARQWWEEIVGELGSRIPWIGDPAPGDLLRLAVLEDLIRRTEPGALGGTDFQGMIEAAPRMSKEELRRAKQSLQTTLDLAKTALNTIDARLKPRAK